MDYTIKLRASRTDYVSATNKKQTIGIHGPCGIGDISVYSEKTYKHISCVPETSYSNLVLI